MGSWQPAAGEFRYLPTAICQLLLLPRRLFNGDGRGFFGSGSASAFAAAAGRFLAVAAVVGFALGFGGMIAGFDSVNRQEFACVFAFAEVSAAFHHALLDAAEYGVGDQAAVQVDSAGGFVDYAG